MAEFVVMTAGCLLLLFVLVPVVAKLSDMAYKAQEAARYTAWERTVWYKTNANERMLPSQIDLKDGFLASRTDEDVLNSAERRMTVPAHADGRAALDKALAERGWQDATMVAFQPGASTMSRRWPRSRFIAAAAEMVKARPDLRFVVTGSPAEAALCQEVTAGIEAAAPLVGGTRAWASAGQLPLIALPDLLRRASLLVTGDTGPMHLAVTVDTPVVALFAVSDPARSGPGYDLDKHVIIRKWRTCDPCYSKNCPYAEPICMDNIAVDEVVAAVDTILSRELA